MASHALNVIRVMVLSKVEPISEELFDVQPEPFNNTIRWNLGHMISVMNGLTFARIQQDSKLPQSFTDMFKTGTKPADWTTTPPSKEELMALLKKQLDEVQETFGGRLDEPIAAPFQIRDFKFETVGEVLGFAIIHESQHLNAIHDLAKIILHQQG